MIMIGIKDISTLELSEIRERAEGYSPFYRDYILAPIAEKDGKIQTNHAAARLANVAFLHRFCKYKFAEMPAFSTKNNQKPCFDDACGVAFSFSHSGRLAVCAVSVRDAWGELDDECTELDGYDERKCAPDSALNADSDGECVFSLDCDAGEIGIDVQAAECEKELSYIHEKVAERFFSGEDFADLLSSPTEESFIRLWTRTESVAKKTGVGMAKYKSAACGDTKIQTFSLDCAGDKYFLSIAT